MDEDRLIQLASMSSKYYILRELDVINDFAKKKKIQKSFRHLIFIIY